MVCTLKFLIAILDRAFVATRPRDHWIEVCEGSDMSYEERDDLRGRADEVLQDMNRKYKETSEAGLAVSVTLC
jgi:hypothetical protein